MGRTGTLWAYEQTGVVPDALTSAKALGGGLPIGALVTGEKLADTLQPGDHGSTFAGGPVACAAALAALEICSEPGLLAHVTAMGERLSAALEELPFVVSVRGRGLLLGAELASGRLGDRAGPPRAARRATRDQRDRSVEPAHGAAADRHRGADRRSRQAPGAAGAVSDREGLLSTSSPLTAARSALAPAFTVEQEARTGHPVVRDELGKIVCRMVVAVAPGAGWWVEVQPLRGYDKERERIEWLLLQHGFAAAADWSNVDVAMQPDERSDVVVARVLLRLREIQDAEPAGHARGDRHRVPARFPRRDPPHPLGAAGDARGVRAGRSGAGARLVQVAAGPDQRDPRPRRLPARFRGAAGDGARSDAGRPRAAAMRCSTARHQGARAAMEEALRSEQARTLNTEWLEILEVLVLEDEAGRPDAARPIGDLAAERIRKVHRRMVQMGRAITPDSPPEQLPRAAQEGQGAALPARAVRDAAVRRRGRQADDQDAQGPAGRARLHQDREVQIEMLKELATSSSVQARRRRRADGDRRADRAPRGGRGSGPRKFRGQLRRVRVRGTMQARGGGLRNELLDDLHR